MPAAAHHSRAGAGSLLHRHGADPAKLEQLFRHCAIPVVARVKTIGHEYAFARPPPWWLPHGRTKVRRAIIAG